MAGHSAAADRHRGPHSLRVRDPGNGAAGKEFVKALKAADGSMVSLITGSLKASLTNPANGKTITVNLSGPFKEIDFPDGSVTILGKGHQFTTLTPADQARFGLPGFFVAAGSLTTTGDPFGNITSMSLDGHVLVDVCAALR
jgi:hypothetical protein